MQMEGSVSSRSSKLEPPSRATLKGAFHSLRKQKVMGSADLPPEMPIWPMGRMLCTVENRRDFKQLSEQCCTIGRGPLDLLG